MSDNPEAQERAAFEAWLTSAGRAHQIKPHPRFPGYEENMVQGWWAAWLARADLAQQAATPTSESADTEALPEPEGWLYDWTHSSALGRPDEHFTGFSKDLAYAHDKSKSHENPRPAYTADQMRAAIAAARQATTPAPPGHNYVECSCGPREGCTAPCDRKLRKAAPEAIAKATGEQQ